MPSVTPNPEDRLLTEFPLPDAWVRMVIRMIPFLLQAAIHAFLLILLVGIHRFVSGILFLILSGVVVGTAGYLLYRAVGPLILSVRRPSFPRNPYMARMEKEGLPHGLAFASGFEIFVIPPKEDDTPADDDGSDNPNAESGETE